MKKQCHSIVFQVSILTILFVEGVMGPVLAYPPLEERSRSQRIANRDFPSIFQAWNPIDMNGVSLKTNADRLQAAARHDLLWEEPVSQLGYGVKLVLGAEWDHQHGGLAKRFTPTSQRLALANRTSMLKQNPNMLFLMEIRWKDAPGSYLPASSDWWMRDNTGERKTGWLGGPEPYYYLNYQHPGFRDRIAEQARVAVASGVYDGIMLDWWGSHGENEPNALDFLKKIRTAIGEDAIIVVNNDRLAPLPKSAPYVNGAFMEMHRRWLQGPDQWQETRTQLQWFEKHLRAPATNCLEIQAGPIRDMRAGLALGLIYSNGYYLYATLDNSDPSPDHLHVWHEIYDVDLGQAVGPAFERADGAAQRNYKQGLVVYNPPTNAVVRIQFEEERTQASDGVQAKTFTLDPGHGDIYGYRVKTDGIPKP